MVEPKNSKVDALNYQVLITKVEQKHFASLVSSFAQLFLLDSFVAEQILKSYPIVFLSGIKRDEYKAIKPKLLNTSKSGVEFTVTTKTLVSVPCVSWLTRPRYTEPGGKLVKHVEFQWRGNAFVCPNCGETFLFQRLGNPLARFSKTKEKSVEKATPVPPSALPSVSQTEDVGFQWRGNVFVCPNCGESFLFRRIGNPLARFIKAKEKPAEVTPTPPVAAPSVSQPKEVPKVAPAEQENVPLADPVPAAPSSKASEDVVELTPIPSGASEEGIVELTPLPPSEIPDEGLPEAVDILTEEVPPVAPVKEAPGTTSEAPTDTGRHNVFLSRIISKDKKGTAAKLITEIKGISIEESRKLVDRMLIPVLKEVTKSEARTCLGKFKELGVSGKITKVSRK